MRPVICDIGPISVHSWGTMLVLALAVGAWLASREFKRMGRDPWQAFDLTLWVGIGGLVGSRVVYVLLEWPSYAERPLAIITDLYGLSWHGAIIGGFMTAYFFVRKINLPIAQAADIAAVPVCLGYSIARVGCFLAGCCYGLPAAVPWAVNFFDVPRHPTQLYSAALNSVVLGVLLLLKRRPRPFAGALWLYYLGLYSIERFIVEFWRDSLRIWGWLSLAQAMSLVVAAGCLATIAILARRSRAFPAGETTS